MHVYQFYKTHCKIKVYRMKLRLRLCLIITVAIVVDVIVDCGIIRIGNFLLRGRGILSHHEGTMNHVQNVRCSETEGTCNAFGVPHDYDVYEIEERVSV